MSSHRGPITADGKGRLRRMLPTPAAQLLIALMSMAGAQSLAAGEFPVPLPVEPAPNVVTLPERYPASWIFLHDLHFASLIDGRIVLVDLAAPTGNLKGQIPASQLAGFLAARTRRELYVAETFYSRGTRGLRTDVITIYDTATLAPVAEIVLPDGRRGQFLPLKTTFQMSADEHYGFVFNFTPAASVTVVDLEKRRVLSEIDTPGCALVYPTGLRGFSTLCSDGRLSTIRLTEAGQVLEQTDSPVFNDLDRDPLFMFHATVGGIAYVPTYLGRVQPIDLRAEKAIVLPAWPLVSPQEAASGWRPSGWQVVASDDAGGLYVLMQSDGREGSHKNGGTEVWLYDIGRKQRIRRIELASLAVSIEITRGATPRLVAARPSGLIDIYDVNNSKLQKSLGAQIAHDPLVLHRVP